MNSIGKNAHAEKLLEVRDLHTSFYTSRGIIRAVRGVSFEIAQGEMLGLVGESGSGKSVTAFSVLNQISPPGKIDSGEIMWRGEDLRKLNRKQERKSRNAKISMVFQEPLTALNPAFTVGWQISEAFRLHGISDTYEIYDRTINLLEKVKLPDPKRRMQEYSYQFSGGMRQRALIALSLACGPELIFADEPTSALDVTVAADILDLLSSLRESIGMAVMLISHNLNLVGERCERILVMYAGQIIESALSEDLFRNPLHPYTAVLLGSLPALHHKGRLDVLPGEAPDLMREIHGCAFAPRCALAKQLCFEVQPEMKEIPNEKAHRCACHLVFGGGVL